MFRFALSHFSTSIWFFLLGFKNFLSPDSYLNTDTKK